MCMLMCMCMLNRRVQILFDKDLWKRLSKSAKSQNISAGEFIRRAVKVELEKNKEPENERRGPFKRLFKRQVKQL